MGKKNEQQTVDRLAVSAGITANELLAEDVLNDADQLRAVGVPTPEWRADSLAHVAELSAVERDQLETGWVEYKTARGEEDNVGFRAYCVAFCLCDSQRGRLFPTSSDVDRAADKIARRNGKATSRLFNTISRINGLTKADIDVLEGNSDATQPLADAGSGESL